MGWSAKPLSLFNTISKNTVHNLLSHEIEPVNNKLSIQDSQLVNKSIMKSILSLGISAGLFLNIPQLPILSHNTLLNRQGIEVLSYDRIFQLL